MKKLKIKNKVIFCWLGVLLILVSGCGPSSKNERSNSTVLSYQELVNYPTSCENKDSQLSQLHELQKLKNFADDPDELNDEDHAYNGRLKATSWWYSYRCGEV